MENAPLIRIFARRTQPEYEERYTKWTTEVHFPLLVTIPGNMGIRRYRIVRENPQYPTTITIHEHESWTAMLKRSSYPKFVDISRDSQTAWGSRGATIWHSAYELAKSFTNDSAVSGENATLKAENAPVIQLEGYSLPSAEEEKHGTWFSKWGYEVHIPLLMKLPGLREYCHYKLRAMPLTSLPDFYKPESSVEYPTFLSILTFDSLKAFEEYQKSLELASLKSAFNLLFPRGLNFKWYVQYQLMKSWRK